MYINVEKQKQKIKIKTRKSSRKELGQVPKQLAVTHLFAPRQFLR